MLTEYTTVRDVRKNLKLLSIGSDPEFCVVSPVTGIEVPASNLISGGTGAAFGTDGNSSTGEIRPEPAFDPLEHAKNIGKLLQNNLVREPISTMELYGSNRRASIGGHLWLGNPLLSGKDIVRKTAYAIKLHPKEFDVSDSEVLSNMSLSFPSVIDRDIYDVEQKCVDNLITNLDNLLTFPVMFLENKEHARNRRNNGDYGELGDFRDDRDFGLEYRSLPSWIGSEKLTQGVLCLAYAIAHQSLFNDLKIDPLTTMDGFRNLFNNANKQILKPFLDKAKHDIRTKLSLYPQYKKEIEYILLSATQEKELITSEIKLGWSIPHTFVKEIVMLTAKELVDKLVGLLRATPTVESLGQHSPVFAFIQYQGEDAGCSDISRRLNVCLEQILKSASTIDFNGKIKQVYIYGRAVNRGEVIDISFQDIKLEAKKALRLKSIIENVISTMGYEKPVTVKMHPRKSFQWRGNEVPVEGNIEAKIGIGYNLRMSNKYIPEVIAFITLMFVNDSLYRVYKVNRETGRKVTLPLIASTFLNAVKKIKDAQKIVKPANDRQSTSNEIIL